MVNLSLATNASGSTYASVRYPSGETAELSGDNPSERITIEDDGTLSVDVYGLESDLNEYPYSWEISASNTEGADEWQDTSATAVELGEHSGRINTDATRTCGVGPESLAVPWFSSLQTETTPTPRTQKVSTGVGGVENFPATEYTKLELTFSTVAVSGLRKISTN